MHDICKNILSYINRVTGPNKGFIFLIIINNHDLFFLEFEHKYYKIIFSPYISGENNSNKKIEISNF